MSAAMKETLTAAALWNPDEQRFTRLAFPFSACIELHEGGVAARASAHNRGRGEVCYPVRVTIETIED